MRQLATCALFVALLVALEAAAPRILQAGQADEPISFTPLVPIPGTVFNQAQRECITTGGNPLSSGCTTTLPSYLRGLYLTGVALAGLFAVFSIVRGGFTLLFTDSVLNRLEGKKIILQALGGVVIVYSSYLLLNTINPSLADDLDLKLEFQRPRRLEATPDFYAQYRQALSDGEIAAKTDYLNISKNLGDTEKKAQALEQKAADLRNQVEISDLSQPISKDDATKLKEASILEIQAREIRRTEVALGGINQSLGWGIAQSDKLLTAKLGYDCSGADEASCGVRHHIFKIEQIASAHIYELQQQSAAVNVDLSAQIAQVRTAADQAKATLRAELQKHVREQQ